MSDQIMYNPAPRGNNATRKQMKALFDRVDHLEKRMEKLEKKKTVRATKQEPKQEPKQEEKEAE